MKIRQQFSDDGNIEFRTIQADSINKMNYVDYLEYKAKRIVLLSTDLARTEALINNPEGWQPDNEFEAKIFKNSIEFTAETFLTIWGTEITSSFKEIFTKDICWKDQTKLLKGESLTINKLEALTFFALGSCNYLYSFLQFETCPGFNKTLMPSIWTVENKKVLRSGSTYYSDAQIRHYNEQRKTFNVKLFEKGDEWHCLFNTYNALKGLEKGELGSHFHYVSSKYTRNKNKFITTEELIADFQNGRYNLSKLPHIPLTDYGIQK
jgi:hypothetical protein